MYYGKFSDKYSGRHGRTERLGKAGRRELEAQAAQIKAREKAKRQEAYKEARSKAGRKNLSGILDALKGIFRRAA